MIFEEWYSHEFGEADFYMKQKNMSAWNAGLKQGREEIKQQVLDILAKAPRNNPNLMSTFQMDQQSEVEKQIKSL